MADESPALPNADANQQGMSVDTWVALAINAISKHPLLEDLFKKISGASALEWFARLQGFHPAQIINILRAMRPVVERIKGEAHDALLEFASAGLEQYFGSGVFNVGASERGIFGDPAEGEVRLGRAALLAMFRTLDSAGDISPASGFENAQLLISFALKSAIEGWLLKNFEEAAVGNPLFPNYGDLHEVVSGALGFGRVLRRVFGPLLQVLVVEPTTRHLHSKFFGAFYNEGQATRAFHMGALEEGEYFDVLAELGWPRDRAAILRSMNTSHLDLGDLERGSELAVLDEGDVRRSLQLLGYDVPQADKLLEIHRQARLQRVLTETATTLRELYAKRDLDIEEFQLGLNQTINDQDVRKALFGLGDLVRSKATHPPIARIEKAYEEGLIDLERLRRAYYVEGFSDEDSATFEQLALKARIAFEAAAKKKAAAADPSAGTRLSRGAAEEAHRHGLLTDGELSAAYSALGFTGARLATLMRLAAAKRAEFVAAEQKKEAPKPGPVTPRAAMEEAFVRGVIDEGRMRAVLASEKLAAGDVEAIMGTLRQRRDEMEQRKADLASRKKTSTGKPAPSLPRAAAEAAYRLGLITEAQLTAYYQRERFTPDSIAVLLADATAKRDAFVSAQQKHQAPPKVKEPALSTHEQAFVHGLIDEGELQAVYEDQGYDPEDVQLLLELAVQRRDHAATAAAATAASSASKKRHPQAPA